MRSARAKVRQSKSLWRNRDDASDHVLIAQIQVLAIIDYSVHNQTVLPIAVLLDRAEAPRLPVLSKQRILPAPPGLAMALHRAWGP